MAKSKNPDAYFPTRQIGETSITAISDGYLTANLDFLSNIDLVDALGMQRAAGARDPRAIHINCYLVRQNGRTVLIDAGAGGIKHWGGELTRNLLRAGVAPSAIDAIVLTHAHPDHIGGLMDASGQPAFANAELVVHEREIAFWQDDSNLARASLRSQGNFLIARRAFGGYRDRLRTFSRGEVLPAITAVPLPGHTEGHCGYRIDSGSESLLIWGDIVHFPQIQIPRPEVAITFDQDAALAVETRSKLLDRAAADRLLIAGMHLGEAGFARIERKQSAYDLVYEE